MTPKEYIEAREEAKKTLRLSDVDDNERQQQKRYIKYMIDDRPYYPNLYVDTTNYDTMKDVVIQILGLHPHLSKDVLDVSRVLGGNTNVLYCVSNIMDHHVISTTNNNMLMIPQSVLIRIFGAHGLIDRDVETSTYAALAEQGLALAYYGRFANGRIEEWSDWKPLTESDMAKPDISSYIAIQLARLHCQFTIPKHLLEYHNPKGTPTMWIQLDSWLETALDKQSKFTTDHDKQRIRALQIDKLKNELDWLRQYVISQHAKIGFCHNDLLASNILSTVPLQLIDFEYGGINYLSYDIANHFNEFAGGTSPEDNATPNYDLFPSEQLQRNFCSAYIEETLSYTTNNMSIPSRRIMEEKVSSLILEIKGFVLANHLVWGLWGINQAAAIAEEKTTKTQQSPVNDDQRHNNENNSDGDDFDYLHYGSCRIRRYFYEKEQYLIANQKLV